MDRDKYTDLDIHVAKDAEAETYDASLGPDRMGTLVYQLTGGKVAMISTAVEPEYQHHGVSAELIAGARDDITDSGKVTTRRYMPPTSDVVRGTDTEHKRRSFFGDGGMNDEPFPEAGEDSLTAIFNERRVLLNLAFRMLGSSYDAEDVVQETYTRWYGLSEEVQRSIKSPMGWLVRVASRICLDQLSSARVRRERYVGEWLPEPLPDTSWDTVRPAYGGTDPADQVSLDESVTMGVLVILDTVTPAERVSFVLHDIFGVPFNEIAETVGRTPAACRQLAASARRRVRTAEPRRTVSAQHKDVVSEFKYACETGNLDALIGLLDANAVARSDGGGRARTPLRPIVGADRIARFLKGVLRKELGISFTEERVSGQPGVVARIDGVTVLVMSLNLDDAGLIDRLWVMMHPQKLHAWRNRDVSRILSR
jgi:RNA polymerase sigma-70 factor (ECF subfamily)